MRSAKHTKTHRQENHPNGRSIHQATYQLAPPLDLAPHHLAGATSLVIVSTSIDPKSGVNETIIAPTTPNANRLGAEVLRVPATTHQAALEKLGYRLRPS